MYVLAEGGQQLRLVLWSVVHRLSRRFRLHASHWHVDELLLCAFLCVLIVPLFWQQCRLTSYVSGRFAALPSQYQSAPWSLIGRDAHKMPDADNCQRPQAASVLSELSEGVCMQGKQTAVTSTP